jgi:hypothetical protein
LWAHPPINNADVIVSDLRTPKSTPNFEQDCLDARRRVHIATIGKPAIRTTPFAFHCILQNFPSLATTMISMAADGLTRRRGARLHEQTQQGGAADKRRRQQAVIPIPPLVLVLSGTILIGATLFIIWYHAVHDQDE